MSLTKLLRPRNLTRFPLTRSFTTSTQPTPAARNSSAEAHPPPQAPKPPQPSSSNTGLLFFGALGIAGAFAYVYKDDIFGLTPVDYQKVYNEIASILENNSYDDGSYGPVLVRLAWHACGTYDIKTKTGGSNGATMRFAPESAHGANAGLSLARDLLEKIKQKYPGISYSDLWSLAGVVAIQEMVSTYSYTIVILLG
jgi:cytochrome c peroxidase